MGFRELASDETFDPLPASNFRELAPDETFEPLQRPSLSQRLAAGPVGDFIQGTLETLAKPAQLVNEYIAKPLVPFPDVFKALPYIAEGRRPPDADSLTLSNPFPDIINKPTEVAFEKTREVSPGLANLAEGLIMNRAAGALPHVPVKSVLSRAFERVKGRTPVDRAETMQAMRDEPGFVEAIKEERVRPIEEAKPQEQAPPTFRELKPDEVIEPLKAEEAAAVQPEQPAPIVPEPPPTIEPLATVPAPIQANKIVDIPVENLKLSTEVPNFKKGADKTTGVVRGQQLQGEFDRQGLAPIIAWERTNGDLEIITGRHRLDLAKRRGEETIPAQIVREAEGFDARAARIVDAEQNIKDEKGTVEDYARYFRESTITAEAAKNRGLLSRASQLDSWVLGKDAASETFDSFTAGNITADQAVAIAKSAPKDADLQRVGLLYALKNPKAGPSEISNFVKVISDSGKPPPQAYDQMSMFGDDAAVKQAMAMSKEAAGILGELKRERADLGLAKKPQSRIDRAKAQGINIEDPAVVLKRIEQLNSEIQSWENWAVRPDLVARLRGEPVPDISLVKEATPGAMGFPRKKETSGEPSLFDQPKAETTRPERRGAGPLDMPRDEYIETERGKADFQGSDPETAATRAAAEWDRLKAEPTPLFEQTLAGKQAVIPGAEERTIPQGGLKPKARQAEKLTPLEEATIEPDLSQTSFMDLMKKGIGSETGAVGKLTPEQQAVESGARAARKEIYKRLSDEAARTGEDIETVAERMKLPPGILQRLQAEQEVSRTGESATSIKNASVDKELAEMGRPPATHGERMSFEEARSAAAQKIKDDPFAGQKLVDELVGKPRPATATEDALLLHEQTRLKNERIQAEEQLIAAQKSGDQAAIDQAKARVEGITADFMTLGDVVTQVGTESSLSLGHRRMMMKEDYSLAVMERSKQVSNDGKPLTDVQRTEVKTLHEKITSTQKAFDEYVAKAETQRAEAESKLAHSRLVIEAAEKPIVEVPPYFKSLAERIVASLENEADAARVRLHEKLYRVSAGVDPTIVSDAAIIGAAKIARGAVEFGRWSKVMIDDLGEAISPYLKAVWEAANKNLDARIERIAAPIREPVKRAVKKMDLAEQIGATKDRIQAKVESGKETDISPLAQKLARLHIEQGIKERNALIDAVHGELKDIMPEISRRETMDAISGYGQYKQLTKDEISVQLRDLKGQMQQVGKLEDIQAKEPPLKTGVERRTASNEERRLIQMVNEAKRRFGIVVTDPAKQLQSALGAIKTRLQNSIADLKYQIANRQKIVREKTATPYDAEALRLKAEQDVLLTEFNQIFGKPEMTDAQRVKAAMAATERSITDLEQRIKTGDIGPRTQLSKTPSTPELEAVRARRDALQEQLQELRDLAEPKKTPEQIALQSLKTRLKNQTADLSDRLARGDFGKKPLRTIQFDAEANRLHFENAKVKAQWNEALTKDRLAHRSILAKIIGGVGEVMNTTRAILTSFDLSGVLRQGGFIAFGHPIRALESFPAMFRALLSERGQHRVNQEILSRKNYPLYKQSKLYLAEHGQTLSQMEEAYMSRWSDKIPGVAASQRAYVTFLNKLRADSFDAMARTLGRSGEITPTEGNAIANFVNVATGRGNLGMKENALVGLNTVFFAPRNAASRFQLIAGQPMYRGTFRTRTLIAKEYGRFLIGAGMVYGLAKMSGAEVETDSRSSDFGKIKIGNTRRDPLAGLLQVTVLLSRLATGETKQLRTGKVSPIRGDKVPYGGSNAADVMATFLRTKLSPVVGTGVNILAGTNVVGEPTTPESVAKGLLIPLSLQDIYDAMVDQGMPSAAVSGVLSIFGMGLQTFDSSRKRVKDRSTFAERWGLNTEQPQQTKRFKSLQDLREQAYQ